MFLNSVDVDVECFGDTNELLPLFFPIGFERFLLKCKSDIYNLLKVVVGVVNEPVKAAILNTNLTLVLVEYLIK